MGHARLGVDLVAQDLVLERVSPEDERHDRLDQDARDLRTPGAHHGRLADPGEALVGLDFDEHGKAGKLPW